MNAKLLAAAGALALAGCIGVDAPRQMVSYNASALAPTADAQGWYTFGGTRFKGNLLDGAPHGSGLCIDKSSYRSTPVPCTYARGERTDAAYLAEKRAEIKDRKEEQERERREEAAWRAQQAREREQARKEADAWLANQMARQPQRMREQMAQVEAASRGTTVEAEAAQARRKAELDSIMAEQAADPNSELNQNKRRAEKQAQERHDAEAKAEQVRKQREADRKATVAAETHKRTVAASEARQQEERDRAAAAKKEADEKAQKERERARLEAERVAKEEARRREEEARKREQERQARIAAEKAAKEAEERAIRQAKADYLQALTRATKLNVHSCPGDKRYFVFGLLPKVSPKKVDCIDVHYRARCEGSAISTDGVIKTFLGASTDCFMGDAAEISPTPSCPIKEVRVEVVRVTGCGE